MPLSTIVGRVDRVHDRVVAKAFQRTMRGGSDQRLCAEKARAFLIPRYDISLAPVYPAVTGSSIDVDGDACLQNSILE